MTPNKLHADVHDEPRSEPQINPRRIADTPQDDAVRASGYGARHLPATHAVTAAEPISGTRAVNGPEVTGRTTLTPLTKATAILGSLFYLLWGLLHIQAGVKVARLGLRLHESTMLQGRVYQASFYLLSSAGAIIVVALVSNWKVSNWKGWKFGYWLTLGIAAVSDVSFILFILVPGYIKLWPGLQGPLAWGIAMIFWTWSYVLRSRTDRSHRRPRGG